MMNIQHHLQSFRPYPEDKEEVRLSLHNRVVGLVCHCGRAKRASTMFCEDCRSLILNTGDLVQMWRMSWSGYCLAKSYGGAFEYVCYDLLCDAVDALRFGRWDGRSKQKSLEREGD